VRATSWRTRPNRDLNCSSPLLVIGSHCSIIFCVHGYAKLNLAIERDADQDIVELNVRLSYSETHVPNWLLQQLHALDRLDGRAFALPFDVIPEMKMSRSVITSLGTIIVVLAPYLVSVYGSTDAELLCR